MSRLHAIAVAAFAAAGCSWGKVPAPRVTEVTPNSMIRGVDLILVVRGEGFYGDGIVDFDTRSAEVPCSAFRVVLRAPNVNPLPVPIELDRVQAISSTVIQARLPGAATAAAARASWDVVVIDWLGREARLPASLEIKGCDTSGQQCDDGDDCTQGDACNGAARCAGVTTAPDGAPCSFACTSGAPVAGVCLSGACQPNPGLCDPLPVCAIP